MPQTLRVVSLGAPVAGKEIIQLATNLTEPTVPAQPVIAAHSLGSVSLLQTEVMEGFTARRAVAQLQSEHLISGCHRS